MPGTPGSPAQPPGIWGPTDPRPNPPIHLPGEEGGGGDGNKLEVKVGWTPQTGWIVVLVPGEGATVPTPSATKVEVTKAEAG